MAITDNFNSYSDGDLVGQGGWVAGGATNHLQVEGTVVYEGAKAVKSNNSAGAMKKFTAASTGSFEWKWRQESTVRNMNVDLYTNNGATYVGRCFWQNSAGSWLGYQGNGGTQVDLLSGPSFGTWYRVEVQWDSSQGIRMRLWNGSSWGAWGAWSTSSTFGTYPNVDAMYLYDDGGDGALKYWDDIVNTGSVSVTATPSALNTTWATQAATISAIQNVTDTPSTLNVTTATLATTESGAAGVSPNLLNVTWATLAADILLPDYTYPVPSALNVTFATEAPTPLLDMTVFPPALDVAIATQSSAVEIDVTWSQNLLNVTFATIAPGFSLDAVTTPSVLGITIATQAATESGEAIEAASTLNVTIAALTPSFALDFVSAPSPLALTWAILTPTSIRGDFWEALYAGNPSSDPWSGKYGANPSSDPYNDKY